jgi:DNA-binding LacI/PurR family transcriptional regulator
VRLADIAGRAGVSQATVSRVLNNRPGVAAATREAVWAAIDAMGHQVPLRVRPRTAGLVGLIVPELENPIFPKFAQVLETEFVRHGYASVLCTLTPGGVHEDDYVQLLQARGVAGIVFVSGIHAVVSTNAARYARLREQGMPIVLVNGYLEGVDAPFVSNDDSAVAHLSVAHLTEHGHRRIGLATGPHRYLTVQRRITGFRAAMRRHVGAAVEAADVDELVVCTEFTADGGAAAARTLLDRGATAIVCGSDVMALGAVQAARELGLRVPHDVSVVGSDDTPLMRFTDPPLTTVRQPVEAMATAAVGALLADLSGVRSPRAEYVFRPELVVRGSTAKAPSAARRRRTARALDEGPSSLNAL